MHEMENFKIINNIRLVAFETTTLCAQQEIMILVVWQESNETDFLITFNFILFTNQGYPPSKLFPWAATQRRRPFSIACSSAGRLLLVYLSGRRLRSSGYYPKYQNGAISSGF